jgi:hypothetical protein
MITGNKEKCSFLSLCEFFLWFLDIFLIFHIFLRFCSQSAMQHTPPPAYPYAPGSYPYVNPQYGQPQQFYPPPPQPMFIPHFSPSMPPVMPIYPPSVDYSSPHLSPVHAFHHGHDSQMPPTTMQLTAQARSGYSRPTYNPQPHPSHLQQQQQQQQQQPVLRQSAHEFIPSPARPHESAHTTAPQQVTPQKPEPVLPSVEPTKTPEFKPATPQTQPPSQTIAEKTSVVTPSTPTAEAKPATVATSASQKLATPVAETTTNTPVAATPVTTPAAAAIPVATTPAAAAAATPAAAAAATPAAAAAATPVAATTTTPATDPSLAAGTAVPNGHPVAKSSSEVPDTSVQQATTTATTTTTTTTAGEKDEVKNTENDGKDEDATEGEASATDYDDVTTRPSSGSMELTADGKKRYAPDYLRRFRDVSLNSPKMNTNYNFRDLIIIFHFLFFLLDHVRYSA